MSNSKILAITIAAMFLVPSTMLAQATSTASTTPVVITPTATSTQVICMQNALEKRENALIASHDTYSTAVKTALQNRLSGLKSSWELDRKARIAKREATYKAFRLEMQTANNNLRTTKNTTWKTFQTDAKNCGVKSTGESASMISTMNVSL